MKFSELLNKIKSLFVKVEWLKVLLATVLAIAAAVVCRLDVAPPKNYIISAGVFLIVFLLVLIAFKERLTCSCLDTIKNCKFLFDNSIENIFLIAYGIYMALTISGHSTMVTGNAAIHSIVTAIRFVAMAIATAIILLRYIKHEYSKKNLLIIAGVTVIVLIVSYTSKDYDPIKYWLFIIAAFGVELRKIIKVSCIAHIIMIPAIVLLSLNETAGMVNLIYVQGDRIRQSLGFGYTTVGSNLWMYTILMWLYWRQEKARLWEHAALAVIAVFFYIRTDTRSAFALSILTIVVALVLKTIPKLQKCNQVYKLGAILISVLFPLGIIVYSICGDANSRLFTNLNSFLNGRLQLGQSGFQNYGITLFGQQIDWSGLILADGSWEYNYVDSSYVRMLLNYGVVFVAIVIVYFIFIMIRGSEKKDTFLLAAVSIVIVHATFDPQLIFMEFDAFAMALSYVLIKSDKISDGKEMIDSVK